MSPSERDPVEPRRRLEEVFTRHAPELTRFARRRVGADSAGDVVSSVFVVACRRVEELPADNARPWLYAIARYVIANEIRGQRRREQLDERVTRGVSESSPDVIEGVAERLHVHAALSRLPAADQEVLRLTEWEQLTAHEAAEVLGCSTIAFKARLYRARRRFTAALEAEDSGRTAPTRQAEISVQRLNAGPTSNVR